MSFTNSSNSLNRESNFNPISFHFLPIKLSDVNFKITIEWRYSQHTITLFSKKETFFLRSHTEIQISAPNNIMHLSEQKTSDSENYNRAHFMFKIRIKLVNEIILATSQTITLFQDSGRLDLEQG